MESYFHWLALKQVPGVGAILYKRLIETFKSPEAVFAADEEALFAVEGISETVAKNILTLNSLDDVKRERDKIEKEGVRLLTLTDPDYPPLLLTIYDPPPVLYAKGRNIKSDPYPIAVVGTREMTLYGKSVVERICGELARAGLTVVSGFARGIDAAAHRVAMTAGGRTVAVFGSGIDCIYPKEHRKLYDEIVEKGVVFSEFSMGTGPEPHHFPQRNRIISGLSLGCVVIEAARKSGSLITARYALEQGREVFATPGSIFSETSFGVHSLIRSGAKLVEKAEDILEELSPQARTALPIEPSPMGRIAKTAVAELSRRVELVGEEEKLYRLLSEEPKHVDTIIAESSWEPSVVSHRLLELELKGAVRQLAGQFYVRE